MKKLLSLFLVAGIIGFSFGCADETKSTKKTETTKEVKKDGGTEKTTETKELKKEDGKVIEKKEDKKVEQK
jgi:hypothetical protein